MKPTVAGDLIARYLDATAAAAPVRKDVRSVPSMTAKGSAVAGSLRM